MSVLGAGGKLRRSFRRFGVWEEAEEENPTQVSESESKRRDGSMDGGMDIMDQQQGQEVPAAAEFLSNSVSFALSQLVSNPLSNNLT